jgi:hypothetical protein
MGDFGRFRRSAKATASRDFDGRTAADGSSDFGASTAPPPTQSLAVQTAPEVAGNSGTRTSVGASLSLAGAVGDRRDLLGGDRGMSDLPIAIDPMEPDVTEQMDVEESTCL